AMRRSGFTWIELVLVLGIFAVVLAIGVPNLVGARKHGNEAMAIGSLKAVITAEGIFREKQKTVLRYGSLDELSSRGLVDDEVGTGEKRGYRFQVAPSTTTSEF